MVQLDIVRSGNNALVSTQPLVAVFVGGTSGIGEYAVRALAATHSMHGKGLRLYIVGRNAGAAEGLIAACTRTCPGADFRFVRAGNLALIKDVDSVCAEITRLEEAEKATGGHARIDMLYMSQAYLAFDARNETPEGLDAILSLLYYSRMRFALGLLPLLLASALPAHVISIYGAGKEGALFPADLSLREPKHYGFATTRSHVVYMTTFFLEALAQQHPGKLSLTHVYPGLVWTPGFRSGTLPAWARWAFYVTGPVMRLFSISAQECGERMVFLSSGRFRARATEGVTVLGGEGEVAIGTDGTRGGGAYAVYSDGETIPTRKEYEKWRAEGMGGKVWEHTVKAFEDIAAGGVFTG